MPYYSKQSMRHRAMLHGELIEVLDAVLEEATDEQDFAIIDGLRNEREQTLAFQNGTSQAEYAKSYHNGSFDEDGIWHDDISDAADVMPYPIEWPDKEKDLPYEYVHKMLRIYDLAYRILKKADELGIALEWGGMFKSFFDGPHYQRKRS